MNDNDVHMIEDDESYASSNLSGFSSCSEKFEDLPDGLTEEVYVAEMMRRDAYYAERRIRKNRERGIEQQQQQQQRSGNSVGSIAASQDGEGYHRRGEHRQPSDEMDVESSSSISDSSLSPEGLRDAAMERQRREYIRLQEAHLSLLLMARERLQLQQQEMKDDVYQHEPNENEDDEYGMGEQPKQQQEVRSHNEESDGSNVPKGAYKRQIEEYEWLQRKHRQKTQSSTASASSAAGVSGSQHGVGSCPSSNYAQANCQSGSDFKPEAGYTKDKELCDHQTAESKDGSAKYAKEEDEEEKDSKMPSEPRYYIATTSQNGDNTVPVTCTHCSGNLYRHSNQYGAYICEICRGLMREV